jgi:hypothetical protein
MIRKTARKLSLETSTVRTLTEARLGDVAGGATATCTGTAACSTGTHCYTWRPGCQITSNC